MSILDLRLGDTVKFGRYPQSRSADIEGFTVEPIEWLVLDIIDDEDEVLLISKNALDCQLYHDREEAITWAECSLRAWLNGDFLKNAFDENERRGIAERLVPAHKAREQKTDAGADTVDKVFSLSVKEAEKYFYTPEAGVCKPTDYAKHEGACVADDGNCKFWLRSAGFFQDNAAYIDHNGCVGEFGDYIINGDSAVRPAIRVSLEALFPEG